MKKLQSPMTRIRNDRGWTTGQFATVLGISAGSLGNAEHGHTTIPIVCLERLEELGYDPVGVLLEHEVFLTELRALRRGHGDLASVPLMDRNQRLGS